MLFALLTAAQIVAAMPVQVNGTPLGMLAFERRHDGVAGTVTTLEITIGADGALQRCDVVGPSGPGHLDRSICDGFRRSRFIPGRDRQGIAITAFTRYRYAIERDAVPAIMPPKTDFSIPVDHLPATATRPVVGVLLVTGPDGKVVDCIVGTTSGNLILDRLACATMASTDMTPVRDGDGRPVRAIPELAIGFVVTPAAAAQPSAHAAPDA